MEEKLLQKIEEQNIQINEMQRKIDKMYKSFMATIWITVALVVIPLIAAIFIIPKVMSTYMSAFDGLL